MSRTGAWGVAFVLVLLAGVQAQQGGPPQGGPRGGPRGGPQGGPPGAAGAQAAPSGKTLRVPADHPTIQKAIDAAGPGDTVLVEGGTYKERVRLKAGVILKSAGADGAGKVGLARAEATVIDGEGKTEGGPGVVMAEGSVLDGFTITRIGKFDQAEYDTHYATHGENLPDERGAVGSPDHPNAVSLPGVTAIVRNTIVHDNGDAGIAAMGGGKRNGSWIVANVVYRNMGGGIGSAEGATPLIEGNRCTNNLRGGIGNRKSAAVIVNNECFDNVRAGIGIREGSTPIVRGNKCYKNRRAGIGVRMEGTAPVVEDNDCYQNAMAGIGCRAGARPFIRGNRCYENTLAGIGAMEGAHPVISGNKCYRNKEAGIGIQGKSTAVISDNECYENEKAGIGQREESETLVTGNHVHHNKLSGIGFEGGGGGGEHQHGPGPGVPGAAPKGPGGPAETLPGGHQHGAGPKGPGATTTEGHAHGKSLVDKNKVVENGMVAIGIHAGWNVRVTNNLLSREGGMPPVVMVYKGSQAEFSGNTFRGSGVAAIRTEGVVRVVSNVFESTSPRKGRGGPPQSAVWALPGSDVLFAENTIKGLRQGLNADQGATVTEFGNKVSD